MKISTTRFIVLFLLAILLLTACDEEVTPTPTPPLPTGVAMNPARVWIDRPLNGDMVMDQAMSPLAVVHAAGLGGSGELEIRDETQQLLRTVPLGAPVEALRAGGLLSRYEADWLTEMRPLLQDINGPMSLHLQAIVDGVISEPVILTVRQATPTTTPSPTLSPSPTLTTTATATDTHTPSPTSSPTLTPTWTLTSTPTLTPTASLTPSITLTPTDVPPVGFVEKEPRPCTVQAVRSFDVPAMLAPNRQTIVYLDSSRKYQVSGYAEAGGQIWWRVALPETNTEGFVPDRMVYTEGSCLLVTVVVPPQPRPPRIVTTVPPDNPPPRPPGDQSPVIYYFRASSPYVTEESCSTISWSVEFVDAVFFNGTGVVGNGSYRACPEEFEWGEIQARTYTLTIYKNGAAVDSRSLTLFFSYDAPPVIPTTKAPPTRIPTPTPTKWIVD